MGSARGAHNLLELGLQPPSSSLREATPVFASRRLLLQQPPLGIMFNSSYSVSPNQPQHSRFHYDAAPAPGERSAPNRYHDQYEQGGDHSYQLQQQHSGHSYFDRHSPPSRSSRDDRGSHSSSPLQPTASLRRKSQQDWARPRGASGSTLRPGPQSIQRPPAPVDENSAVLERMAAAGWMDVGHGSVGGHGDEEGYVISYHGSMDSGYGSGHGGDEGKSGGLGSWSALKKAVGFSDEDVRKLKFPLSTMHTTPASTSEAV